MAAMTRIRAIAITERAVDELRSAIVCACGLSLALAASWHPF